MKVMLSSWQMWALLSAGFTAQTAVFAKVSLDNINRDGRQLGGRGRDRGRRGARRVARLT
ncbi:MAG: hypothetical protein V4820_18570 [Pseudomonadota bacterium]